MTLGFRLIPWQLAEANRLQGLAEQLSNPYGSTTWVRAQCLTPIQHING